MQIASFVSIEEKLGPITHAEMRQLARAVAQTVFRYVADERQAEAYEYLRRQTLRQEVHCGGETVAESHDRHGVWARRRARYLRRVQSVEADVGTRFSQWRRIA
jgi:hypothetical protein